MTKTARYILYAILAAAFWAFSVGSTWASSGGDAAHPGMGDILFSLVIILLAAKLGGHLMERFGQPSVLGELIFGVIIGNLYLIGMPYFESLKGNEAVHVMAEIGVILLLFEVGLESTISDMIKMCT